ncbi:caspase family protein [Streptomyces collinus]|uniref:caspase, EACC1-associated type n=1 Tax=Streptomyces collinus TaxID=42684 RepID=UPI00363091BC
MSRDRSRSRAILIGTSHHRDPAIRPLPAASCVSALTDLLTSEVCGWPRERVTAIEDAETPRDAVMELVAQVRDVTDVLLVYFVGHGMRTRDGRLALALTGTVADPEVLGDSALLYPRLAEVLRGSPAATKLVILDCCHAELGLDAEFHFQSGTGDLADVAPVDGLYFIGASSRYEKAKSPLGGRLTHFTHAFVDVVGNGIPGSSAELTLRQIFVETRARLLRERLPQPVDGGVRDAFQFPFARNAAHRPDGDGTDPGRAWPGRTYTGPPDAAPGPAGGAGPDPSVVRVEPPGPRRPGRRALLLAGLGVTAVAAPLGLAPLLSPGKRATGDGTGGSRSAGAALRPVPAGSMRASDALDAAFSPDGRRLALGVLDGTIELWDVATRRRTAVLPDLTGPALLGVRAVAFSPDGAILAGSDSGERKGEARFDGVISLWDTNTRKRLATLTDKGVVGTGSLAFSPKGAVLAGGNGNGTISIWSVGAHAKIHTLTTAVAGARTITKEVNSVAFSPDGSILASSTVAGLVELWDGATYDWTATLAGNETGVGALAFSPDGKVLAGATAAKAVHLWDVAAHKAMPGLTYTDDADEGVASIIGSLAFTPDGAHLVAGTEAGLLLIWNVATRKIVARLGRFTLSGGGSASVVAAVSPDGRTLAGVLTGKVNLWRLR